MTASLLDDVFAHHIWATERLIDECSALTPEQLAAPAPGTYGSIIDTFRHLVSSDGWYLSFLREQPAPIDEEADVTLAELRAAITANGVAWKDLLAAGPDGEADIAEHGDRWGAHGAASSLGARRIADGRSSARYRAPTPVRPTRTPDRTRAASTGLEMAGARGFEPAEPASSHLPRAATPSGSRSRGSMSRRGTRLQAPSSRGA